MNSVIAWWKSSKYAVWAVLGVMAMIVGLVLRGIFAPRSIGVAYSPSAVPSALQKKVDQAQEEAMIAKVKANAQADADHAKLQEVVKNPDGVERRKQLAALLENL
jgi:hypothetical protein